MWIKVLPFKRLLDDYPIFLDYRCDSFNKAIISQKQAVVEGECSMVEKKLEWYLLFIR